MFQAAYEPLLKTTEAGTVAILPWDSDLFGFRVGDLVAGSGLELQRHGVAFTEALQHWAARNQVALIACYCAGTDSLKQAILSSSGFNLVDYSLQTNLPRLQAVQWPNLPSMVRLAVPDDRDRVIEIAQRAFQFGRYHSDPYFPKDLANQRYGLWVRNVFDRPQPQDQLYVIGEHGNPSGFFHVAINGTLADLRLGAIDPELQGGIGGYHLYVGTLRALRDAGLRRATARISAANTAVLNIYAALGFQFAQPQAIFHWHAPNSPHLVSSQ